MSEMMDNDMEEGQLQIDIQTMNNSCFDAQSDKICLIIDNPEDMKHLWRHQPELLPSLILHLLIFLIGVTGHISLLYYLHTRHIKRHNINTGMFLASLSVAELLLLLIYLPLELTKDVLTQEVRGGSVCKIKEFIKMLTALATVINLAAVSFERYIVVVHPFKLVGFLSRSKCRLAVLSLWLLAWILSIPVIFSTDVYSIVYTDVNQSVFVEVFKCSEDTSNDGEPWKGRAVSLYQLFSLLIIPAVITIFCYQAVIRVLWRSVKDVQGLTGVSGVGANTGAGATIRCHHFILHQDREISVSLSTPSDSHADSARHVGHADRPSRHVDTIVSHTRDKESMNLTTLNIPAADNLKLCSCKQFRHQSSQACSAAKAINRGRRRIIKMLVIMLIVYYLCWGSWLASKLVGWWLQDTGLTFTQAFYRFSIMAKHLPTVHATINPFIYCFMSANFRKLLVGWRSRFIPKY